MKKYLLFVIVFALFAGCSQPTTETPETQAGTTPEVTTPATVTPETPVVSETGQSYYVKNSKWENVDLSVIAANLESKSASSVARAVVSREAIDLIDAENIVKEYNTVTNDDQLRLYTEDVPIEESPTVDVYIAKPVDGHYVIVAQSLGMDRSYYVEKRQLFEQDAITQGGVLFVDKVPETVPVVVPVVDNRTREEKNAIYMINKYNKIVVYNGLKYEVHADQEWDALKGTGPSLGYPTIDDYFAMRLDSFYKDMQIVGLVPADTPWRVVSGQLYTEPTDPPVTE